jgi:hypothetical protein
MSTLTCPKCGKKYNSNELRVYRCKSCRVWIEFDEQEVPQAVVTDQIALDPLLELDPATKALVLASNRTTYAVRSLAMFLFTTLCTSLVGYGLIGASSGVAAGCDSYSPCGAEAMVIWGWVVISFGFFIGLIAGISELSKSRP